MIFDLPRAVEFGGRAWDINTDYRDILTILIAFDDPDLNDRQKAYVCLHNIYPDFANIPQEDMQAAFDAALAFIDHGGGDDERVSPRVMDWEQDADMIFAAVNRSAGYEVRAVDYMHWWTFLGLFMEIKDSTCSFVMGLRQKKARGKPLEKAEREFWNENREICELRRKLTAEEQAEEEELKRLLG